MHQQVDCQYGFTRTRATLNENSAFLVVFQALKHSPDAHVEADGLLIQKVKHRRTTNHGCKRVLKRFGWLNPAMVNQVEKVSFG